MLRSKRNRFWRDPTSPFWQRCVETVSLRRLERSQFFAGGSVFSRVLRDSTPRFVGLSVGPSVGSSHFTFLVFCGLWPHCSCPNDQVTSNTAPAHLHATGVAVYQALFTVYVSVPSKGVFLATDNFVFSRPLSQFLRSFACNTHFSTCSAAVIWPFPLLPRSVQWLDYSLHS